MMMMTMSYSLCSGRMMKMTIGIHTRSLSMMSSTLTSGCSYQLIPSTMSLRMPPVRSMSKSKGHQLARVPKPVAAHLKKSYDKRMKKLKRKRANDPDADYKKEIREMMPERLRLSAPTKWARGEEKAMRQKRGQAATLTVHPSLYDINIGKGIDHLSMLEPLGESETPDIVTPRMAARYTLSTPKDIKYLGDELNTPVWGSLEDIQTAVTPFHLRNTLMVDHTDDTQRSWLIERSNSIEEILRAYNNSHRVRKNKSKGFNGQMLVKTMNAIVRLYTNKSISPDVHPILHEDPRFNHVLMGLCSKWLHDLQPREIATASWCMARLGVRSVKVWRALAEEAYSLGSEFSATDLAKLTIAFSHESLIPSGLPERIFRVILKFLPYKAQDLNASDAADVTEVFWKMGAPRVRKLAEHSRSENAFSSIMSNIANDESEESTLPSVIEVKLEENECYNLVPTASGSFVVTSQGTLAIPHVPDTKSTNGTSYELGESTYANLPQRYVLLIEALTTRIAYCADDLVPLQRSRMLRALMELGAAPIVDGRDRGDKCTALVVGGGNPLVDVPLVQILFSYQCGIMKLPTSAHMEMLLLLNNYRSVARIAGNIGERSMLLLENYILKMDPKETTAVSYFLSEFHFGASGKPKSTSVDPFISTRSLVLKLCDHVVATASLFPPHKLARTALNLALINYGASIPVILASISSYRSIMGRANCTNLALLACAASKGDHSEHSDLAKFMKGVGRQFKERPGEFSVIGLSTLEHAMTSRYWPLSAARLRGFNQFDPDRPNISKIQPSENLKLLRVELQEARRMADQGLIHSSSRSRIALSGPKTMLPLLLPRGLDVMKEPSAEKSQWSDTSEELHDENIDLGVFG